MELYEYHIPFSDYIVNQTPINLKDVKRPHEWLWTNTPNGWEAVKKIEDLTNCQCIGACAAGILPDNMKCEVDEFNKRK